MRPRHFSRGTGRGINATARTDTTLLVMDGEPFLSKFVVGWLAVILYNFEKLFTCVIALQL